MSNAHTFSIVNVGYRSTNYWVVSVGRSRLLVDLGWPGTMGAMRANLHRMGVPLGEIRYGLATHYHPDHAGLAEDLKRAGMPLLVVDVQTAAIQGLNALAKPRDGYTSITAHGNLTITCAESRAVLERIGLSGEIVHTPGHSDDSVSLLLDGGSVFTGDLTAPALAGDVDGRAARESWSDLRRRGASCVYPGHGASGPLRLPWEE